MENEPLILGLEDGTIDVERLLVEPQDGHASMDSVLCFNDKIPENAMDVEEVTHNFDISHSGIVRSGEDILNDEICGAIRGEVGYLQLQNDFCSTREEYLLGVEFAKSIADLDYGSSDVLQNSVSNGSDLASSCGADTQWESDLCRIMETPCCHKAKINVGGHSEFNDFPSCHDCEAPDEEKPLKPLTSCSLHNIDKFEDISSYSFPDILSDENDRNLSTGNEKNDDSEMATQENENKRFEGQDLSATISAHADTVPPQKRSRKPTQRYINELADNISRYPKKRRDASSPSLKKCLGANNVKKYHVGSKATRLPAEESSVIAIQVPFASLVQKESQKSHACDTVQSSRHENLVASSKDNHQAPENLKKRNGSVTTVHLRRRDDFVVARSPKGKDNLVLAKSPNKRDYFVVAKKRDHRIISMSQRKKDECVSAESSEEVTHRRKHHRLWSITEVRKLIDGVSQYGVGRWSRIKKIFFSASPHRTSVDLKDKWRNLLKASGMQEQGDKKRNPAWRPLPKSILRRVCELATTYPYPKDQKPKLGHRSGNSPDGGTERTLNDKKRILCSINDN